MALLSDDRRRSAATRAVLACAGAALAGCVLFETLNGTDGPAFSHAIHVEGEGLDCTTCHAGVEDGDEPGMPGPGVCSLCHEEGDESLPPERRPESFFDGDVYRAAHASRLGDEVIFSHLTHVEAGALCESCHGDVGQSERITAEVAVSMDDCMQCHTALNQSNDCSTCHSAIGKDIPPGTHQQQWIKLHGQVYRSGDDALVNDCSLCHHESSCTTCHRAVPPESHTNYFRRRAHGLIASMDRDSCAACHQSDSCDRCHRESQPLNHTGPWGSTQNTHCLSCHIGDSQQGCSVCHQDAPSHLLAPPKPPDHSPGMNCLQCHGVTAPLPHVDKGDDCNICHM